MRLQAGGGKHLPRCYSSRTVDHLRSTLVVGVLTLVVALSGCKREDEITSFSAPKEPKRLALGEAGSSADVTDVGSEGVAGGAGGGVGDVAFAGGVEAAVAASG